MLDLFTYAAILLVMGLASMAFIVVVIRRQLQLFKIPITDTSVRHFRYVLFALALTIIITNLIPVSIDALSLFVNLGRPKEVRMLSVVYAMSVHINALLSSYFIWRLYRLAGDPREVTDFTESQLSDNIKEKREK